ncbi:hypothetical protein OG378_28050 [Streptomyces gougerotii]|nr:MULTISPECIES: hypothetical protein [Streptomyces]WSU39720.1 hypothetical protein OG378_28050 [Streptomyces gougerotii]
MAETGRQADYVLPAASQFERWEATFFTFEFPHNTFHLRAPVLDPLPGTLPEPEIYARLVSELDAVPRGRLTCARRPAWAAPRTSSPSPPWPSSTSPLSPRPRTCCTRPSVSPSPTGPAPPPCCGLSRSASPRSTPPPCAGPDTETPTPVRRGAGGTVRDHLHRGRVQRRTERPP